MLTPLDLIPPPYSLIVKIGIPVLAIVGVWIAGDVHGHHAQKHSDEAQIARITQDRDTHASNERVLQGALDRQNAAVSALKADGDKRTSDGKTALAAAQRANLTLKQQADALRKSGSTPRPKDWPCVPSDGLISLGKI